MGGEVRQRGRPAEGGARREGGVLGPGGGRFRDTRPAAFCYRYLPGLRLQLQLRADEVLQVLDHLLEVVAGGGGGGGGVVGGEVLGEAVEAGAGVAAAQHGARHGLAAEAGQGRHQRGGGGEHGGGVAQRAGQRHHGAASRGDHNPVYLTISHSGTAFI